MAEKVRTKHGGRVKGTPNKVTGELKEMILTALEKAGGIDYLVNKAESHPQAFMTLVGKVLPMTIAGDKDNPFLIKDISSKPLEENSNTWLESSQQVIEGNAEEIE